MSIPAAQARAAALLSRLTGGAGPVETHISAVFIGPDRVLKLKKAVSLGFLDFTTAEARHRFAARELEINASAAPELYRALHGITAAADRLVGPEDPSATEWALEMAPVPPEDFLDAVAARGGIDEALQDALGAMAVSLRAAYPRAAGPIEPEAAFRAVLRGNARAAVGAGLDPARVVAWRRTAGRLLRRLAPLLRARAAEGQLRRCHGDLHLGNVLLWEGRPVPFDALEFDEALATIDTGYDLAFLIADLLHRCGRPAACRVLSRAVALGGDAGAVGALPLWLSTRAMIRAHCLARMAGQGEGAQAFLTEAEAYLLPPPPRIVAVGGLQGTGKTRLARALAARFGAAPGALHLRSDEIRKRLAGVPPETPLPPGAYTPEASTAVHEALFAQARAALRGGHSVVADAAFLDPERRAGIEAVAREAGVPFTGLWLEAPLEVLRGRIAARRGDASDATVAVLEYAASKPLGGVTWHRLDASGDPLAAALAVAHLQSC
ncbi:bifunctional aminoglycoside phosphotransferase/ATP-binding protein [Roseomonas populi]|uniref:AAA family ATPase n=1 Tax=Roseomonas populi TaxID=3121582 RepID=A0ABT1X466_9PROT|nr:bifunctional aminoglycoside phosphotransferase/ATP-binding protein [Roseomonas pecuniae]MCR0982509.1 AAA family ATPase [Roseomonas pecuniae]